MSKTRNISKKSESYFPNAREKLSEPTAATYCINDVPPLKSKIIGQTVMSKPATYVTTDFQLDSTNR